MAAAEITRQPARNTGREGQGTAAGPADPPLEPCLVVRTSPVPTKISRQLLSSTSSSLTWSSSGSDSAAAVPSP